MQGAADHGVSEALYLADVDGNGIEIYRDRPRGEWPIVDGRLQMGADPIDFDDLLAAADEKPASAGEGLAHGTVIGHVHLHVSRIADAQRFYVDVLGFELVQRYGPSALFVSAGGYHHHVGLNTWAGVGAPPPPPGAVGLRHFDVRLPGDAAVADVLVRVRAADVPIESVTGGFLVRDPAGNAICFRAA
jgi:catechol 2,3-dioxygenase